LRGCWRRGRVGKEDRLRERRKESEGEGKGIHW
jgi:hypothetical protein